MVLVKTTHEFLANLVLIKDIIGSFFGKCTFKGIWMSRPGIWTSYSLRLVALGGLMVIELATGPKAEDDGFWGW
jgi:hypothetical protein